MESYNPFIQNLRLRTGLLLLIASAVLTTPQAALAQAPTVNSISLVGKTVNKAGDKIQIEVQFSTWVVVTGTPQFKLTVGSTNKTVDYTRRSGHTTLVFEYTVIAGDTDTDGVTYGANAIALNGGTIMSVGGLTRATLTHAGISESIYKVDTTAPTVSSLTMKSTATNNYYVENDIIEVTATFSENVTVNTTGGTPQLTLKVGTADETANYASGTGTKKLVFQYTVVSGDADADGIEIEADKLSRNGGTIKDAGGNAATLTHTALAEQESHKVDTTAPTVSSLSITSTATNNYYKANDKIQVQVTFSEVVKITGTPRLTLTIGNSDKTAAYESGGGTKKLVFAYTVASGDTDTDGISVKANQLSLNGSTIKDTAGNPATRTHTALSAQVSHKVDTTAPTVSGVAVTSSAGADKTYKKGDKIQVQVTFSENMAVTGTPQLTLDIGGSDKTAAYESGGGTKKLVFAYTVASGDTDTDGIEIAANKLANNGGSTITDVVGNPATLTHTALGAQTAHKVDGVAPTVSSVSISSTPSSNSTYKLGDTIQATVTFSGNVTVDTTDGTPQLTLKIGAAYRAANYIGGATTADLLFRYTVAAGDADTDGIEIESNQLSLNGGTITDSIGNAAGLKHTALGAQPTHKVDGVAPTVSSVSISSTPSSSSTYKLGDTIQVQMTFSETVDVTGTPRVTLTIGTANRAAAYVSGSGSTALVFAYTVVSGDTDTDGISIAANRLVLNGGTIKDAAGNAATLTHTALSVQASHKVDAIVPVIPNNGIRITSTPTSNDTYTEGETIQIQVTFTKTVYVTGTPRLTLKIGTADRAAAYTSAGGTANLVFAYTVAAGDEDTDGISIAVNQLVLNGGTIKDAVGNAAALAHTALSVQATHKVDAIVRVIPKNGIRITSTPSSNNTYRKGETIQVQGTFAGNATVTGTPQLTLKVGTADRAANYTSGTGTTTLVFAYTVAAGDEDTDGIGIEADTLSLNGGTITDVNGNAAVLTHPALTAQPSHQVDAVGPTVKTDGIKITSNAGADAIYAKGDKIQIQMTFTEKVLVDTTNGTPRLTLTIGTESKIAVYRRGTGTASLVFEYKVATGDEDTDGIEIAANQLSLNNSTITDMEGNAATLTHTALPTQIYHKVSAVGPTINTDGLAITSTSANNYYQQGVVLQVTVTFNEAVTVTGTPTLGVTIGTSNKNVAYTTGSGTATLLFEYTIAAGDADTNGVSIAANQLVLNGGTIADAEGHAADVTHRALDTQAAHKVDGIVPTVATPNGIRISSTPSSNDTYTAGETLQVQVTFTENVAVTNTPEVTLKIGASDELAAYKRGTGTKTLVFAYTVLPGYTDTDGIEIEANKLSLNDGTITDAAGNPASLTHTALPTQTGHKVDATQPPPLDPQQVVPTVSSVVLRSTGPYSVGDTIEVTVATSESISVMGDPNLTLVVGAANRTARYNRGSMSAALVFRYTVAAGEADTDGVAVKANSLTLNGGTLKNGSGKALVLDHSGITNAGTSHAVDTTAPTVKTNGLSITSTSVNNYYKQGATLQVTATFSENVKVTGTPTLTLTIGTAKKTANYASGGGTPALLFEYTVVSGDTDTDGISIGANQLSGTITDLAGTAATLRHTALRAQASHKIDSIVPTVVTNGLSMTSTPNSGDTYKTGEKIQVQVTFREKVTVSGTPQLTLKVGSEDKTADYTSGTGTTSLVFEYTVVAGDTDTDGISISANQLSGIIKDAAGNAATLTHTALPTHASHKVSGTTTTPPTDTTDPTVSSLAITSTGAPYSVSETIQVQVTFDEVVTVTGTPQLTLKVGSEDKTADYASGSGTTALVFGYTVVSGDTDNNGVEVKANKLSHNGGSTIKDTANNDATLTHTALAAQAAHTVDTTVPTVSTVAITSSPPNDGTYKAGDTVQATVSFSEGVTVTGTPQLTLKIGTADKEANYASGSGSTALVFEYTIASGDMDADGIEIAANQLSRNGGTIKDTAGNAATLTHAAVPAGGSGNVQSRALAQGMAAAQGAALTDQVNHKVDTSLPSITSTPDGVNTDLTQTLPPTQTAPKVGVPPTPAPGSSPEQQVKDTSDNTLDPNAEFRKTQNPHRPEDTSDNTSDPNPPQLPDQGPTQHVDTTAPQVSSVVFASVGPYTVADVIKITVTTTENVTVTGTPRIPIVMGEVTKYARYVKGSGTTALVFEYTVAAGDTDTDGIEVPENALEHDNGSTIKSHYQIDLTLSHASLPADTNHIVNTAHPVMTADTNHSVESTHPVMTTDPKPSVDTVQPAMTADTEQRVESTQPVMTGIAFATDAPAVYTAGSTVEVILTFAETGVKVTPDASGTMPSLSLLFGSNADPDSQKQVLAASYKEARPGSTKLVFTYSVTAETPIDTDGVQIQAGSLKIPAGAAITDAGENPIAATPSEDGSSLVDIKPAARLSSRPILPSLTAAGIVFNEFLNAETDKHDWVELRNTTETEVSLGSWKLHISGGTAAQTEIVAFPDMTLPGGAVLLLVNTGHKETHLEHSDAATYRYLKVPELRLRGADFSLMLRDPSGAIVDVISSSAVNTEDAEAPTGFKRDTAYLREQPNTPGYEPSAWQASGYQGGLGYNRKAAKETSLGTPGYLRTALVPQGQTPSVNISEIMFTTGTSGGLPQWIELYNASKTEVVAVQDWHLHVEVADPMRQPMHRLMTFIIQRPLRILPKQTVLVVTKNGRNSQHFPEHRLYTLTEQHPETGARLQPDADLLGDYGYAIVLRDASGTRIDIAGNLDGNGNTSDAPRWKLPNCITANGFRSSIIRQYEAGAPLMGTHKSSWFRATEIRRQIITYYGHPKDIGNPGWKKGGPLPVQLSSFRAERTEQGALLQWTTTSELENAGFNLLRSETKTGTFTVVTPRMLQGAGTTSERSRYQYVDTTAKETVAYYYRLEEVSFSGVQQPVATRRLRGHISAANRYLTTFGSLKKERIE